MKKMESLYQLETMGLNVPEILHYQKAQSDEVDQQKLNLILQTIQRRNGRLSVRTEKDGEFKSPFLPNALVPDVRRFINERHLVGNYEILITRGVPTNSIIRGNCVPNSYNNYFEYLVGPGTVRDIDEAGRTPKNINLIWGQNPTQLGRLVSSALQLVNSHLFPQRFELGGKIVEFSVFSKPVGIKRDKVIFWEVRAYGGSPRI